jgi:hypothetical protein
MTTLRDDSGLNLHPARVEPIRPAEERWVRWVSSAVTLRNDPRTLALWARHVHVSVPTLRGGCYLAGVPPRPSLLLARLLRAVCLARTARASPAELLDARDVRTLRKWLHQGGVPLAANEAPTLQMFLSRQTLVSENRLLVALEQAVALIDLSALQ